MATTDGKKQFFVHTNASKSALAAVFMQMNVRGNLAAVQYASRSLSKTERSFSMSECEAAAVIFSLETFRHHLMGDPFVAYSDL